MPTDYWLKQSASQPLFPDLIWSRPENRQQAGKLLIVSGDATGFAVAAQAYQAAQTSGTGVIRVVMPDILRSAVPKQVQFELDFAPGVAHGGFGKKALNELLAHANWSDAVLLPGGIGRNSETSALLETFTEKYDELLVIAEEALDVFVQSPGRLIERDKTLVVTDFSQAQKLWPKIAPGRPALTYSLPLQQITDMLHQATLQVACVLVIKHQETLLVAYQGQVSATPNTQEIWRVETAAKAAVWAMQHPNKMFEAVTTALIDQQG